MATTKSKSPVKQNSELARKKRKDEMFVDSAQYLNTEQRVLPVPSDLGNPVGRHRETRLANYTVKRWSGWSDELPSDGSK